jgi:hypothetical protein
MNGEEASAGGEFHSGGGIGSAIIAGSGRRKIWTGTNGLPTRGFAGGLLSGLARSASSVRGSG